MLRLLAKKKEVRLIRLGIQVTYLAKVDFVKHHLIGMANSPESSDECQNGCQGEGGPVISFAGRRILLHRSLRKLVKLYLRGGGVVRVRPFGANISLP